MTTYLRWINFRVAFLLLLASILHEVDGDVFYLLAEVEPF